MAPPNDSRNRSGRPRRTPPTIDLKATEVRGDKPDQAGAEAAPAATAVPDPATTTPPHGDAVETPVSGPAAPVAAAGEPSPAGEGTATPPHGDALAAPKPTDMSAAAPATGTPPSAAAPASSATEAGAEPAAAPRARRAKVWPQAETAGEATPAASTAEPPSLTPDPITPANDAPAPTAEPRRSGIGGLIAAGLLGGLIGAGGALLGSSLLRPGPDPRENVAALERKLTTLEQAQAGLAEQARGARSAAESSAARVEAALRAGAGQPGAQPAPDVGPALSAAVTPLAQRLQAVEGEVQARAAALAGIGALQTQVAELSQRLTQTADSLGARLSALDGVNPRLNAIETELKAQGGARAETNAAYDRRFTAQDQRLATQDQRLGAQDQRLQELSRQVAETGPEAVRAGLRVVLSDHLLAVLREGAGYAETLAALRRLNVEPAALQPLEPFAASGAPTLATLRNEFRPLADRMVAASRPAGAQGSSLSDRLWRMADQIVTVRTVGDPSAEDLPGRIARIEQALERDAAAEAAAAWDALPEAARKASEEWGRRLKARAAAEAVARGIAGRALAALEAPAR